MLNNAIIQLNNVSMIRGEKQVLSDINWTVKPRENWFVMGNNGSGKTTLLEIILGYLWPQEGEVFFDGQKFGQVYLPELRTRIGYVAPWVFERMSKRVPVNEVVASGTDASVGFFYGEITAELRQRICDSLALVGCPELFDARFSEISSGQQFKVVLARALVNEPKILILDEPFSLLDIGARRQAYNLLETLYQKSADLQYILVTHHLEDLLSLFTHGLFLKGGRIIKQGLRQDVLTKESLDQAFDLTMDSSE